MVYESDFYTTRRPYSYRPTVTSYSVTRREVPWHLVPTVPRPSQVPPCYTAFGCKGLPTPRHYVVTDTPDRPRRAEEQYSYSYTQESTESRSSNPYSVPSRTYSSSSERVARSTGSGPGNYSYTTERSSRSSDLPGGYHSSYSSTTSGRLPHGTTYRHFSYRDDEDDFLDYIHLRKVQPYHKNIPYVGHKRLVIIHPSSHGWRVKQSSLLGEIDRIYHKVRPSLAYQPKEDYLNSRSMVAFDDETRSIRAKTAEILKKIHTPVPRAQRPLPLPGEAIDEFLKLRHELSNIAMKLIFYPTSLDYDRLYYSHTELPITERIISDNYIDRLLHPTKSVYPVPAITHYDEPRQYSRLGKGHLACLTFAGGRPISRRKNLASVEDYIRDDINVLSHYNRFRQAAEKAPHVPDTEYGSIPHMPPTKSSVTGSWKSNAPRRTQSDKVYARTTDDDHDESQERKKKRREQVEAEAMKEAEEEKRRNQELKRQKELSEKAAAERQAEIERKTREEEEERILQEEVARMEALKKAQEEEERRAKEEEEARIAREEEERKAKEAEAKAEAKRKAKEEMEKRAEEERKAREEEERRLREEEQKAREEEERKAREEEERRLKEEEEERRLKEEEDRLAKEEEERRQKEEEEKKLEEERIAGEEKENVKAEEKEEEEEEEGEVEQVAEEEEEKPEDTKVEKIIENPQTEEVIESEVEETGDEPVVEEPMSPEVETAKPAADEEEEEEEAEEEDE